MSSGREDKAGAAEAGFEFLAENTGDLVLRIDGKGRLTYISASVRTILGYEPEELIGTRPLDLIHHDDQARHLVGALAVLTNEPHGETELERQQRVRTKSGDWRWMEGNPRAIWDDEGELVEVINIVRDVTWRRELQDRAEEQARWAAMAEQLAGVGYWRLDAATQAITWSSQMYAIFGMAPGREPPELAQVLGMIHPSDQAGVRESLAHALSTGEPWTGTITRIIGGDGRSREIEGRAVCETDVEGRVVALFGTMRDITEARAQERLFESAFANAAVGMALTGVDRRFIRVNPAFCQMLGYEEAELIGLDPAAITAAGRFKDDAAGIMRLIRGEIDCYRTDKVYVRKDGSEMWGHLTLTVIRNADGSPRHTVIQVQDLTARRAAEEALRESEARYRRIAENTSDMITTTNTEGRITYVSAAFDGSGGHPESFIGKPVADYIHEDDRERVRAAFHGLVTGREPGRIRWRGRPHDRAVWTWMESRPTVLRDPASGEFLGFLDVARDVTAQVAQEEAVEQARKDAEQAALAKAQFLANMSHEIRTPLTSVLGFTELLARRGDLDAEAQRYVERIEGASRGLLAIVNDILDVSRLEAGGLEIRARPTDVGALAAETLDAFGLQAEAKGLALRCSLASNLPFRVTIDDTRLRQILINLLGNAVKFTEAGEVVVRMAYASEADRLRIEVTDTGGGISPEDCERLFQRFIQADNSSTRRHGGTGLGLAICRGLAEAMGGSIGVTSRVGEGSTFFAELPAPPAALAAVADGEAEDFFLGGAQILVVDDNAWNRELARPMLEALGAAVTEASSGREALEACATTAFDVILMDLHMPGLSGLEALSALRAGGCPNAAAPVLAFTADPSASGLEAFDGVVLKPIATLQLCTQIAQALARREGDASEAATA